jgi:arylsulfatase A-like enzyme
MFLREHGYTTAMFGKWHLGFDWPKRGPKPEDVDFTEPLRGGPTDHGFNRYFGISASLDMPPYVWIENDHVTAPPAGNVGKPIGADFKTEEVQPTLIEKTKAFLAERAAARDRKPFFIYLALAAPGTPVVPTKDFSGKTPTPHGDPCRQIDADVGVLLAALKQHGMAENTLVVFTSDNGFAPAAEDAFEGGHHIPFIVRWPGVTPASSRCTEVIGQVDFFATCAEFLGVEMNDKMAEDSASILSFLRGQPPSEARPALVHHSGEGEFAIRERKWKLILCPGPGGRSPPTPDGVTGLPPFQLYDMSQVPAERQNVAGAHPEIVQRLGRLLRTYIERGRTTPGAAQPYVESPWPQIAWKEKF